MITKQEKLAATEPFRENERDMGSTSVQVAILTSRINDLTGHLTENKKDHASRLGLLKMVGRRRRLLNYLNQNDSEQYQKVITQLKLRK